MKTYWKWGLGFAAVAIAAPLSIYGVRLWQADRFLEEQRAAVVAAGFSLDPEFMNRNAIPDAENANVDYERIYGAWSAELETLTKAVRTGDLVAQEATLVTLQPVLKELTVASRKKFFVRRDYRSASEGPFTEHVKFSRLRSLIPAAVRREMRLGNEELALEHLETARRVQNQLASDWPFVGQFTGMAFGGNERLIGRIAAKTKSPDIRRRCVRLLASPPTVDPRRLIQYELVVTNFASESPNWAKYMEEIVRPEFWRFERLWVRSPILKKEATAKTLQRLVKLSELLGDEEAAASLVRTNDDESLSGRLGYAMFPIYFFRPFSQPRVESRAILLALGETADPFVPYAPSMITRERGNRWCYHDGVNVESPICYWTESNELRQSRGEEEYPVTPW